MFNVIEDSDRRFELEFDNHNQPLLFKPVGSKEELIDLSMGGESAAIAIALSFRQLANNGLNDHLFVFEYIAGDKLFPGPHVAGTVLKYDETDFNPGQGLLNGFDHTNLAVTVGPSREDPFQAKLILTKTKT